MPPFLLFLLNPLSSKWSWIALGFTVISLFAGCEHRRAEAWKEKHQSFVAQTKAIGEAQERATRAKILADKLAKDTADAEYKASIDKLNATVSRLRAERARASLVPAPATGSSNPERATFQRAELERALSQFSGEVEGIVEEGDQARIGLDTAKKWAASIK